jgi:predicted nucleic-acid-binding protein
VIALDTNVIVRYLVQDDRKQAAAATHLFERELSRSSPGFISLPVVCELAWTLASAYGQKRSEIAHAVGLLLEAEQLEVEASDLVADALQDSSAGIADAIIYRKALSEGCSRIVTFDKKFARLQGVQLLQR